MTLCLLTAASFAWRLGGIGVDKELEPALRAPGPPRRPSGRGAGLELVKGAVIGLRSIGGGMMGIGSGTMAAGADDGRRSAMSCWAMVGIGTGESVS